MELRIKHREVLVGAWLNGNCGNIIISPGLPQYIDKHHSVIKRLSQMSYNVFTPRYIGSWESDGKFSVENCIRTLDRTLELVQSGEGVEAYNDIKASWSKSLPLYIIGFSFGALPVLLYQTDIKKIIVCPFVNIAYHTDGVGGEDMEHTFQFLHRGYPNVYRLDVSEIMKELRNIKYPDSGGNLTVVAGSEDDVIPSVEIDFLTQRYAPLVVSLPIGHSLNDVSESDLASILK